jgi:hypothetical protein
VDGGSRGRDGAARIGVGVEQLGAVQRGVDGCRVRGSMAVVVEDVVRRSRSKVGGVRHWVCRWWSEELTVCG